MMLLNSKNIKGSITCVIVWLHLITSAIIGQWELRIELQFDSRITVISMDGTANYELLVAH